MSQNSPRRKMTTDQKRALVIVGILAVALILASVAIFQLGSIFGVPFWVAIIFIVLLVIVVMAVFS